MGCWGETSGPALFMANSRGEIREMEPTASEESTSRSSGSKVEVFCQEGTLDRGLFVFSPNRKLLPCQ